MFGKIWYNQSMTGRTRDYLADLANRKGVSLPNEQERDQAWASRKIYELNELSDATFDEFTDEHAENIQNHIDRVLRGLERWTFQE